MKVVADAECKWKRLKRCVASMVKYAGHISRSLYQACSSTSLVKNGPCANRALPDVRSSFSRPANGQRIVGIPHPVGNSSKRKSDPGCRGHTPIASFCTDVAGTSARASDSRGQNAAGRRYTSPPASRRLCSRIGRPRARDVQRLLEFPSRPHAGLVGLTASCGASHNRHVLGRPLPVRRRGGASINVRRFIEVLYENSSICYAHLLKFGLG